MNILYTYTSPMGVKHHLTQNHLDESFRLLTQAGYDMQEANDLSLEYVIARINISEIDERSLIYGEHQQQKSDELCGLVAARLAQRRVNYVTAKYI